MLYILILFSYILTLSFKTLFMIDKQIFLWWA